MASFVFPMGSMLLAGCANPDDLVHDRMEPIRGASVHRVNMIGTATDRKLFNHTDAHGDVEGWSSDSEVLVCFMVEKKIGMKLGKQRKHPVSYTHL